MVAVSAVFEESAEGEHPRRKGETGRTDNDEDFFASPPSSSSSSSLNTLCSSSSGKRKDNFVVVWKKQSQRVFEERNGGGRRRRRGGEEKTTTTGRRTTFLRYSNDSRSATKNATERRKIIRTPLFLLSPLDNLLLEKMVLKTKDLRGVAEYVNSDGAKTSSSCAVLASL